MIRSVLFAGAVAILLACGCRAPHPTAATAAVPPPRSDAPPGCLIVGQPGSTNVTTEHRFIIQNAAFVRELFATLGRQSTNRLKSVQWMPARPYVFVDEHWEVCRGYMSSVGKQSFNFRPCWVERRGSNYVFTFAEGGDHAVPLDTFQAFLDVWDPEIP